MFLAGAVQLMAEAAQTAPDFPTALFQEPAIATFGQTHGYPILGIEGLAGDSAGQPGNSVTFLVTLKKSHQAKQWLVQLKISGLTAKERASIQHGTFAITMSGGRHFDFETDANTALEVRTAGPFADDSAAPDEKRARAMVGQDFLRLGLDRSCAAFLRMDEAARKDAPKKAPPPALSEEEARAFAGIFPALATFVQEIQGTPGVDEILWAIMDKPSVWSMIRHGGKVQVTVNVDNPAVVDPAAWQSPDPPSYRLPVTIGVFDQPALRCFLFVTSARPPLVASAGIVGIVAVPPSRPEDRLEIRLIAAHAR
jgi:hypothetical protein